MSVTLKIEMLPSTDTTITSRPVEVHNAVTGAKSTVDCHKPDAHFSAEPGAHGYAVPTGDVNPKGKGPPGDSFTWSVPTEPVPEPLPPPEPPVGAPAAAVISSISLVKTAAKAGSTSHPAHK